MSVMLRNEFARKIDMYLYRGLFTTLNKNLSIKQNKIGQQLSKLTHTIQVNVVLFVDILKKQIEIKRNICLLVRIVGINQMMTVLEQ